MSRMSIVDSSVSVGEEDSGSAGASSSTVVPVITISSEELKAFYQTEHSAHKKTKKALQTAKKENKKLKAELGNKKERDSKWGLFHEKQAGARNEVTKTAEPKSPFKIKPIR